MQLNNEPLEDWVKRKAALAAEIDRQERVLKELRARYDALGPKRPGVAALRWNEREKIAFDQRSKLVSEIAAVVAAGVKPKPAARLVAAQAATLGWKGCSEGSIYRVYCRWMKSGRNWQQLHRRHLGDWARARKK